MIKLKDILDEAQKLTANTDTEASQKYKKMYKTSFPTPDGKKWNLTNDKGRMEWYVAVKKWFTDNFGIDERTWKQISKAYDMSRGLFRDNKIRFNGKTYTISTGMDEWEYTFDVLVKAKYITYKTKAVDKLDRAQKWQQMMSNT